MRAALVEQIGHTPRPAEVDEPRREQGQALIEVVAAPINPVDLSIAAGRFYGGTPEVPYVPGREGVGRVLEADSADTGARVRFDAAAGLGGGAFAERALAIESELLPVPDRIEDPIAACLGIAGLTAWLALEWRAQVDGGESVLVLGATGAVGQIAVQAAGLLGAGRVVAAARDAGALERVRELGADETVELDAGGDVASALREAAGGEGPNVVVDPLWGEPAALATEAAAPRARIVHLGQTASPEATLRSGAVRGKSLSILGFVLAMAPRDRRAGAYQRMCEEAASGRLRVEHETLPLDRVGEAWERQASFPHGKLVLVP
jgi:NADPH2:quinone reductase